MTEQDVRLAENRVRKVLYRLDTMRHETDEVKAEVDAVRRDRLQ